MNILNQIRPIVLKVKTMSRKNQDKKIAELLEYIYLKGLADGANAEIIDSDARYLLIQPNTMYICKCPYCQEEMELKLMELAKGDENGPNEA